MLDPRHTQTPLRVHNARGSVIRRAIPVACALAVSLGFVQASASMEIDLSGSGTFKPPTAQQLTRLPVGGPFSAADLEAGTWSFVVRYEDQSIDSDPDPYVGRYSNVIRLFRLTVGTTTVHFPAANAQIVVSDGGLGYPDRESIRIEATAPTSFGVMRASWIQGYQTPSRADLRGPLGMLVSDAIPAPSLLANLSSARPFDRFLMLRIDGLVGDTQPLLYLTSSNISVRVNPTDTR